jgi:hexokinase
LLVFYPESREMSQARPLSECALVADIGGTNARFALADLDTLELSEIRQVLARTIQVSKRPLATMSGV